MYFFTSVEATAQKVGVVLSGGGATAFAHIGVLKALEENDIPIDYITGTSGGALIGGLYAAGFSPDEIDSLMRSENVTRMVNGQLERDFEFYNKTPKEDASMLNFRFSKKADLGNTLPTHLISSTLMDLELFVNLSPATAVANYDFDQLFIPFRCLASDIYTKESVVFDCGFLNEAVRASITYPFFISPITVDGRILFDGGLYNNFPSDVMKASFNPDFIIGSNVSENFSEPTQDNFFSQIGNMMVSSTDFQLDSNGILIQPETIGSTFEFDKIDEFIQTGYDATIKQLKKIRSKISISIEKDSVRSKRINFRKQYPKLQFKNVTITGVNKKQASYLKHLLYGKSDVFDLETFKKNFYKIYTDENVNRLFPKARYNPIDQTYELLLEVKQEKEIEASLGGIVSSQSVTTGFLNFKLHHLGKTAKTIEANTYFGKFYTSFLGKFKLDLPAKSPFHLAPYYILNRFDYFKSQPSFFQDITSSYVVQTERFGGLEMGFKNGNGHQTLIDARFGNLNNQYYQTVDFLSTDTADITSFNTFNVGFEYNKFNLNNKQYATSGSHFHLSGRFINGKEQTTPGSTSIIETAALTQHNWWFVHLKYQKFLARKSKLKPGFYIEGYLSNQSFFSNYTSTILTSKAFHPVPYQKTLFIDEFRAHQFVGGGIQLLYTPMKNIEFRTELYAFQPLKKILKRGDFTPYYSTEFENRFYSGAISAIWHSRLGPAAITINYIDLQEKPFSLVFNFGYFLFNKRIFD